METLTKIQNELISKKTKKDSAGRFQYRTAEEICAALKPLLAENGAAVWFRDDLEEVGGATYIKTTLTYRHADTSIEVTAHAAIDFTHRGMSKEQACGACMSYVHKYALGSLLLIDNEPDPDSLGPAGSSEVLGKAVEAVQRCTSREEVVNLYQRYRHLHQDAAFVEACRLKTQEILQQ